jgi:hypothetical protein
MKGMWTKVYAESGVPFYYNSTLNKSAWKPPFDGVIHEAENLKVPQPAPVLEVGEILNPNLKAKTVVSDDSNVPNTFGSFTPSSLSQDDRGSNNRL